MARAPRKTEHRAQFKPYVDNQEFDMTSLVNRFVQNQSGATAIEYGLIAAGISVAIIAAVNGLGTKLTDTFSTVTNNMK
jgi:pilus assembly protein Flp/PilA